MTVWKWHGLDLFDAWMVTQSTETAASLLELLADLCDESPYPNLPGQQHPDGPGKHIRFEERNGFRVVFVADRNIVPGSLYLSSIQGPNDEGPLTKRQVTET